MELGRQMDGLAPDGWHPPPPRPAWLAGQSPPREPPRCRGSRPAMALLLRRWPSSPQRGRFLSLASPRKKEAGVRRGAGAARARPPRAWGARAQRPGRGYPSGGERERGTQPAPPAAPPRPPGLTFPPPSAFTPAARQRPTSPQRRLRGAGLPHRGDCSTAVAPGAGRAARAGRAPPPAGPGPGVGPPRREARGPAGQAPARPCHLSPSSRPWTPVPPSPAWEMPGPPASRPVPLREAKPTLGFAWQAFFLPPRCDRFACVSCGTWW